jgi:alanine dehydrogenase
VFEGADLIVKVKEPVPAEYDRFGRGRNCSRTCTWRRTRV